MLDEPILIICKFYKCLSTQQTMKEPGHQNDALALTRYSLTIIQSAKTHAVTISFAVAQVAGLVRSAV